MVGFREAWKYFIQTYSNYAWKTSLGFYLQNLLGSYMINIYMTKGVENTRGIIIDLEEKNGNKFFLWTRNIDK